MAGAPGARLAARSVPGVLHPLVRLARCRTASNRPRGGPYFDACPLTVMRLASCSTCSIPEAAELDAAERDDVLTDALLSVIRQELPAPWVTPLVLGCIRRN